jgi:hypothetical protein
VSELERFLKQVTQRDLALVGTRDCVQMIRDAKEKKLSPDLQDALFQLTRKVARMEWGPETEVDDFSEPGFFVVTNGKKSKSL